MRVFLERIFKFVSSPNDKKGNYRLMGFNAVSGCKPDVNLAWGKSSKARHIARMNGYSKTSWLKANRNHFGAHQPQQFVRFLNRKAWEQGGS